MNSYTQETYTDKWLYFRVGTAAANEDDEATGSNMYPAANLLGMCSGTSAADGTITDDDNALSLFLKPIRKTQTAEVQNADANPDVIVLACGQYKQRVVMNNIIAAINSPNNGPYSDGVIVIADMGAGDETGTTNLLQGVTGVTIVSALAAAD